MKLYRFAGRAELFLGCGRLHIDPTVSANLTELKKFAVKWRAQARKELREYQVYIEEIHIKLLSQALIIKTLSAEDTGMLVRNSVELKAWEWNREVPTDPTIRSQMHLKLPNKEI